MILLAIVLLMVSFADDLMTFYYNLQESRDIVWVMLLLLAPLALTLGELCHLRSLEKTQTIALTETLFTWLLGMPLVWWQLGTGHTLKALIYGVLVPSLLRAAVLWFLSAKARAKSV